MPLFDNQIAAILRTQYLTVRNRAGSSAMIFWLLSAIWYGLVALGAYAIWQLLPGIKDPATLVRVVTGGLFLAFLAWQFLPLLLVSAGVTLELKRLLVYPIPPSRLFLIEVLLRVTTGVEVLILMAGGAAGLWAHPEVPFWAPLFLAPFMAFNMLLSAGIRDLLTRLLARKGVRELVIFGFVLLAALPQFVVMFFPAERWRRTDFSGMMDRIPSFPWPWQVAAQLSTGDFSVAALMALGVWTAAGWWFGFSQFQRGLRWDADEVRAKERRSEETVRRVSIKEFLYRIPSRVLPDPLGSLVEKEFRSLSRTPRFRLVFFMGFTFGLLIWLPLFFGRQRTHGPMAENFLVWVSIYAALLLGEVLFWNVFGFDRQATQAYYVMPVSVSRVLLGKNITAVVLLLVEITLVVAACAVLRLPVTPQKVAECYTVTLMLSLYLLAAGNLASTHYPRPIDPNQSWRNSSSGKVQFMLFLVYPLVGIPIALAYLARYAFGTNAAFYSVLGSGFLVAGMAYYVSLESSVEAADRRREQLLAALSRSDGPMGG